MKKIKILLICCLLALGSFSICFGAHFKAFATNNESNKYWDKIESVTSELFGDNKIISMDKLYNFNESPDYVYVEFKDGGYVVYFAETMEMMEFSLSGKLFYNLNNVSKKYYAGPTNIFIKKSGTFINPTTGQKIEQDSVFISDVSQQIYEMFLVTDTKERQNIKVGTSKITYKTGDISNETPDIDTGALIPGAPIGTINATYIPNAIYFTNNPTYGHNTHGTCGSVATQLLLGYNNYYNDRRIILPNHLNGEWNNAIGNGDIFDAGNYLYPSNNLNVCPNPENLNSNIIGTNYDFYNYVISNVEPNAFNCVCTTTEKIVNGDGTTTTIITIHYPDGSVSTNTTISSTQPGETNSIETVHSHNGSTISQVRNGLSAILGNRINSSEYIIDYDETDILSLWSPISSAPIKEEIDAGRPLIIGMRESLGGINHWVVGYGYQDYTYPIGHENANETYSGYVVHFGWTGKNCIWINESWCNSYISLELLHTHNHNIDTGKIVNNNKRELRCETCGHRQLTDLYSTCNNGSTISGVLYPISNNLIIPDSINGVNITSIGANAFENCTNLTSVSGLNNIVSIGAQAFKGCSSLTNISIPAGTTSIGAGAFAGCSNLNISVSSSNPNYSASGNILYNKTGTVINSACNISDTITISSTVMEISPYAFYDNDNLETLHIYGAPTIGMLSFANCENLTDVYCYSYTVPTLGLSAFSNDTFTLYTPYSKQSQYVTAFAGYVNTASSIPVTISFSSDGTVIDTLNTYFGANITGLTNPSKTGYNFAGWYDNIAYMGTVYTNGGLWDTTINMTVYAKWSPQTYYIYFTGYGSENLADKEVTYDALIGTMPSVSRTGYTFYGWKNQYNEYFTSDMSWQKLSNQTVSSDLRANQYTITYNGNGGTANAQSQSVYYDGVISSFASAYREGYTFTGWNTNANGSGQTFTAPYTYVIDDNTTLYAQYTANEYNVTFEKQGGTGGSDGVNATYNSPMPSGTSITAPTKNGYTFLGYYRYADGLGTKYYNSDMTSANIWNLSDDTTLFAYWSANQYTVTLDQQNGAGGTNSVNATYNAAMPSGANITAPTRTGYTFQGYYKYANGGGTKYYNSDMTSHNVWNVAGNSTVYAHWTPNVYNVTLQKESGTGGSNSVNATYLSNMPSATAPTRDGYSFQGYYSLSGGSGTKYYNSDMSSAHTWDVADNGTLYAYWIGNQYNITFNKQGGNGGTNNVVATYGSNMPTAGVSAPTRQGYIFKGYYEYTNANGTKYYDGPTLTSVHTWNKTSDTTLYAYWEQEEYTITFIIYDGMTDSTTLHYGDHVQADYAPYRQHYEFKGYYSGQNGTGICYVRGVLSQTYGDFYTIEPESTSYTWNTYGNGTLYAYWELLVIDYSYQIVVENEGYLPNGTIHIVSGANTVLNAPSIDGYTFKEWNVNGYTRTNGSSYNFELHRSYITGEITIHYYFGGSAAYSDGYLFAVYTKNPSCVAAGTMITLADGTQKRVELLTGNEMLLVWNMYTGQFDTAPILFIDHDTYALYQIINLYFSDGTVVRVIDEHAFWDFNLNKYVFLRQDAAQYIGHWFNKQTYDINNNMIWTSVQLTNVVLTQEYTTAWSPVTYGHLCIYVNGMLSMPGATTGLINIFEVDNTTMTINQAQYLADIATYGVFTYQEFAQLFDIPELVFNAFNGQYLKVSIGKGLIDYDTLGYIIERYSIFFEQI